MDWLSDKEGVKYIKVNIEFKKFKLQSPSFQDKLTSFSNKNHNRCKIIRLKFNSKYWFINQTSNKFIKIYL